MRTVIAAAVALLTGACGSAILKSNEIRLPHGDSEIRMLESGAILVSKRQVGVVKSDGKIVNSRGQLLAWVHDENLRLSGGTSVPISVDAEGAVFLPTSAQERAGLTPISYRVREDGRMSRLKGSRGVDIDGAHSLKNRRIILALLLLTVNKRW